MQAMCVHHSNSKYKQTEYAAMKLDGGERTVCHKRLLEDLLYVKFNYEELLFI